MHWVVVYPLTVLDFIVNNVKFDNHSTHYYGGSIYLHEMDKVIRPNYYENILPETEHEYYIYLKGNIDNVTIHSLDMKENITINELGPGYYSFHIDAYRVYMGPHPGGKLASL